MASLLQQYSIDTIIIILLGAGALFYSYARAFYGGISQWWDRRSFDKNLPSKIDDLQRNLKEEREHNQERELISDDRTEAIYQTLFNLQEIVSSLSETISVRMEDVAAELQSHSKELQIQKDCNRQTMREIIRKQYEIYQRDGYISRSTLEWLEDVYQSYHSVYGNGVATGWMEEMRGVDKK